MATDLTGVSAIVTGATRGIGRAITAQLLKSGARVVATARKQHELDELRETLGPNNLVTVRGSTDDPEHRTLTAKTAFQHHGPLTTVINNAAVNRQYGPLVTADLSEVERTLSANVIAPLGWVQEAWKHGLSAGGSVVNISSIGGMRAGKWIGAYNVSKAALIHQTRQLALELAPEVRVNAIAVGLVPTHFSSALVATGEEELINRHPMARLGTPEDIAGAALFFASPAASWITGQVLVVDGGGTSLGGVSAYIDSTLKTELSN